MTNTNEVKPSNASLEIVDEWLLQQGPELDRERLFSMCRLVDFALTRTSVTSDAARLDWLVAQDDCVVKRGPGTFWVCWMDNYDSARNEHQKGEYATAREAIDAAMSAGGSQNG